VTAIEVHPTLTLRSSANGWAELHCRQASLWVSRPVLQPLVTTALLIPERRSADVA